MWRRTRWSTCLRGMLLGSAGCILVCSSLLAAKKTSVSDVAEVVVIEVPVQVTKDGKPVRGLTPDQFEIVDGRKRRELTGFDAYDLSGASPEQSPMAVRLPAAARRRFLFLFDLAFSERDSIVRAREAAKELVSTGLDSTDLVGVATFEALSGLNLILGFTSDRRQIEIAIETLAPPVLLESTGDPLRITYQPVPEVWGQSQSWMAMTGVTGTTLPTRSVEEASLREAVKEIQTSIESASARTAIGALTSSLADIAQLLRSADGRKYLVFLSEGFGSSVLVGQGSGATQEEQEAIQRQNRASAFGNYQDVDSNLRFGDTSAQNELGRVVQELVRADCVIQAVDISGLRAGADVRPRRGGQEGLFLLANGTGGELFENFNNLSEAMSQMLERTSVTYVLAFHAGGLKLDGQFHKLKVKLEGAPKGARLVHRPGYFAPRPYAELSAQERTLSAASRLFGAPGGELGVATLAVAFETGSQSAYVPSLIEIDGADLLRGTEGGQVTAEIYAYAVATSGEVRDYHSQVLGIDIEKAGPALEQKGLKFWSEFEVPPGEYVARVLVRNSVTGTSGVAVAPFRVPDAKQQEPVLLAPLFPEPAGQWLSIRGQRAAESQHDYPFTVQGQAFEPAVKPILTNGQSAAVLLAGYGLGDTVRITGELLTSEGDPAGRVFLHVGERRPAEEPGLSQWAATLSTGPVEPGDYILKVTATEPETGETNSSTITVSVSG